MTQRDKAISSSELSSASEGSKASDAKQHLQQGEASASSYSDDTPEEVTEEMIDAGLREFRLSFDALSSVSSVSGADLAAIYIAMRRVSQDVS